QEAEGLGRFRPSRCRFERAQLSSWARQARPQIRAEARRPVCLRRWPTASHRARPESCRGLCAGRRNSSFRAPPFLQLVEHVQRQRQPFPYHSRTYKSRPQKILLAYHSERALEAIALRARLRPGIFAAATTAADVRT